MLATCDTGIWAMAPAELLYVAAVTRAARLLGMMIPHAPTDSALRAMAPRLPASVRVVEHDDEGATVVFRGGFLSRLPIWRSR